MSKRARSDSEFECDSKRRRLLAALEREWDTGYWEACQRIMKQLCMLMSKDVWDDVKTGLPEDCVYATRRATDEMRSKDLMRLCDRLSFVHIDDKLYAMDPNACIADLSLIVEKATNEKQHTPLAFSLKDDNEVLDCHVVVQSGARYVSQPASTDWTSAVSSAAWCLCWHVYNDRAHMFKAEEVQVSCSPPYSPMPDEKPVVLVHPRNV